MFSLHVPEYSTMFRKPYMVYHMCPLQFLQLPSTHMYIHDRDVDVVEQFRVEFDRVAGGKEHHHLLAKVLLEECEQQKKSLF